MDFTDEVENTIYTNQVHWGIYKALSDSHYNSLMIRYYKQKLRRINNYNNNDDYISLYRDNIRRSSANDIRRSLPVYFSQPSVKKSADLNDNAMQCNPAAPAVGCQTRPASPVVSIFWDDFEPAINSLPPTLLQNADPKQYQATSSTLEAHSITSTTISVPDGDAELCEDNDDDNTMVCRLCEERHADCVLVPSGQQICRNCAQDWFVDRDNHECPWTQETITQCILLFK